MDKNTRTGKINTDKEQTFILSIQESDWPEVGESLAFLLRGRPRRLRDGQPAGQKKH